jgi:hypothetical protein
MKLAADDPFFSRMRRTTMDMASVAKWRWMGKSVNTT